MSGRVLAALCALTALSVVACTRSSDGATPDDPAFASSVQDAPLSDGAISVDEPSVGETVGSPVEVRGEGQIEAGHTIAAQVRSREPDGSWRWLGNGALEIDSEGRFEGDVAYVLSETAAGIVEVLVVDPASGTVLQRTEVEVELEPSG